MTRPTRAGQERQRRLQLGGEQPLGGEQLPAALEPGEQLAEPDHPDLAGGQARACRGWRRTTGLACTTTLAPSTSGGFSESKSGAGAGDRHRDVGDRVAQRQEDGVDARPAADLGDLALDPHRPEPVDPLEMALAICRTGAGCSGEVSRAMPATLGRAPTTRGFAPTAGSLGDMSVDLGMPGDVADSAVLLAAPRGYCAGVDRAVITVEKALDLYGAPGLRAQADRAQQARRRRPRVARRGLRRGARRGARGRDRGVLRPRRLAGGARRRPPSASLKTIDATCPLVTKVHHEARRFAADDYDILLIGHAGHEEVEGTAGEAPEHIQLVQSPDDVAEHRGPRPGEGRLALADDAVGRRDDGDRGRDPASASRSCSTRRATTSATPPRTASSRSRRSPHGADLVIVVGSANSSNSVRLVEVALEAGAKAAYRVDDASRDRRGLARGRRQGQRHLGRVGARGARRRRAGLPGRARLPRRRGGAHRRGVADLRAAAGAAPRPARRCHRWLRRAFNARLET